MAVLNADEVSKRLAEVLDLATREPVYIEQAGYRVGVVISPERYQQMLEALEEVEDVEAFDAAMAEDGPSIPWAQVEEDLGAE